MRYRRVERRTSKYWCFDFWVNIPLNIPKHQKIKPPSHHYAGHRNWDARSVRRHLSTHYQRKKRDPQKIIDELSSCSSKYALIRVLYRKLKVNDLEMLQIKEQTPLSIFQLFISSSLLQIMSNNINIKTDLERVEESHRQRPWHNTTIAEIEVFLGILLYMSHTVMPRIRDYWNTNLNRAIHALIFNAMSRTRWEQIKRYLKMLDIG